MKEAWKLAGREAMWWWFFWLKTMALGLVLTTGISVVLVPLFLVFKWIAKVC